MTKKTNLNSLIRKSTVATLCAVSILGGSTSTVSAGVAKPLAEVNSLALVNTNNGLDDREPGWINRYGAGVSFDQAQDIYYKPTALPPPNFDTSTLDQINIDIATDILTHLNKSGIAFTSNLAKVDKFTIKDAFGEIPFAYNPQWNVQTRTFSHDFGQGSPNSLRLDVNDRVSQYLESLGAEVRTEPSHSDPSMTTGRAYISPIEGVIFTVNWIFGSSDSMESKVYPGSFSQFYLSIESAPVADEIDTSADVTEPIVVTSR